MHNALMTSEKAADPETQLAAIRAIVSALRQGEVVTYGLVADRAGLPGRARLVGRALRTAPEGMSLPWHRVVGAGGRIAFPAGSEQAEQQAQLLRAEGIDVQGLRVEMPRGTDLDALLWGAPGAVKMQRNQKGDG
jgi:methylated-DNA-protein-cysteine methyltransferase related protein